MPSGPIIIWPSKTPSIILPSGLSLTVAAGVVIISPSPSIEVSSSFAAERLVSASVKRLRNLFICFSGNSDIPRILSVLTFTKSIL